MAPQPEHIQPTNSSGYHPEQEARLLEALAGGSAAAFTTLYDHYHRRLYLHILPFADSDMHAKDAVQEVLFKLWARRETLLGIASLEKYLMRAVKNQLLDLLDKEHKERKYRRQLDVSDTQSATAETDLTFAEYLAVAREAIAQLPAKQRQVFLLRHEENRTVETIATLTGSSVDAVYKNLSRAVAFIKDYLHKYSEWFGLLLLLLRTCDW